MGSLKTGLLIGRRDIDFHIYTDPFKLAESFAALSRLARNRGVKSINYINLLEAEDRCIEWHAFYEDKHGETWQLDLIHILKDSRYDGHFEKAADRILAVLTPETREAILWIKQESSKVKPVMGIEVYQAVIRDGVRDPDSFWEWKAKQPEVGIIAWMP